MTPASAQREREVTCAYDPRGQLIRRLPGLADALRAELPAAALARATDGAVGDVRVGSVWYRSDASCSLRYAVAPALGGCPPTPTVLGRVFPGADAAERYLRDRVAPLAAGVPAFVVPGTAVALHAFPADPDLPTLRAAVSADVVVSVLRRALGDGRAPDRCDVEVAHYARTGPCVLRYVAAAGERSRVIFGKVYPDAAGARAAALLPVIAAALDRGGGGIAVPAVLGYEPALRLLLLDRLPGEPALRTALRAAPSAETDASLAAGMVAAATAIAALHRGELPAGGARSLAAELVDVRRRLDVLQPVWPELADRLIAAARSTVDALVAAPPGAPVCCHGDFTHAQVLLGAGRPALVDFDTVCAGEPALDLGRFLGHLRVALVRTRGAAGLGAADELAARFLDAYRFAAGPVDSRRVVLHTVLTAVRIAASACRQLKADRLQAALDVIDAEVAA